MSTSASARPHYYAMIMAGGGGTRLWPLSRGNTPKQMLPLVEDSSMFRASVERLLPMFPPERILVVTGQRYAEAMLADVPELPYENFIVEPFGRDNGPAALLGTTLIHVRDPHAMVAYLTADHHIADKPKFLRALGAAHDIAQQHSAIVTLGISPSYPATGFGYIHRGRQTGDAEGFPYYAARGFTEKPDLSQAVQFISTGLYSWNSGMFIYRATDAITEFDRQQPDMSALMSQVRPSIGTAHFDDTLAAVWQDMPKRSIDYAIMEGAPRMMVVPIDVGWSDVGSWSTLFEVLSLDDAGNAARGRGADECIQLDTHNTLVVTDRLAVTIGVQDLVIIDTPDALLVCHKDRTQQVRDVVDQLRAHKKEVYL